MIQKIKAATPPPIVAFRSAKGSFRGAKADNPFRRAKGD